MGATLSSPAAKWAAVVIVGYALYVTYSRRNLRGTKGRQRGRSVIQSSAKSMGSPGAHSGTDGASTSQDDTEKGKKRRLKVKKSEGGQKQIPIDTIAKVDESTQHQDNEVKDNQEFARQLQSAQKGTSATTMSKPVKGVKSVKQSRANGNFVSQNINQSNSSAATTSSSTEGADGEDDTPAVNSPEMSAVRTSDTRALDMTDMLEAPSPGPPYYGSGVSNGAQEKDCCRSNAASRDKETTAESQEERRTKSCKGRRRKRSSGSSRETTSHGQRGGRRSCEIRQYICPVQKCPILFLECKSTTI